MPEGDTILRTARTLDRALAGSTLVTATSTVPGLDAASLVGRVVARVDAHGKHLRVHFDDGRTLVTHQRMTGAWHVYRPGERWQRPERGARVVLATATYVAVCFHAPDVTLLAAGGLARDATARSLGPDLLAPDFDRDAARQRLRARGELPIGVALMNQSLVSGIGNVYKSETLFVVGVDPFAFVRDLDDATLDALLDAARDLMHRNLDGHARVTRDDGLARAWVYGRGGEPCGRCGDAVRMTRQGEAGRSTYYCARCQRVAGSRGA